MKVIYIKLLLKLKYFRRIRVLVSLSSSDKILLISRPLSISQRVTSLDDKF